MSSISSIRRGLATLVVTAVTATLLFVAGASGAAAADPVFAGDSISAAGGLVDSRGITGGSNEGSTGETGEPNHQGSGAAINSVWYKFHGRGQAAVISLAKSGFDTVLAV